MEGEGLGTGSVGKPCASARKFETIAVLHAETSDGDGLESPWAIRSCAQYGRKNLSRLAVSMDTVNVGLP